MEPADRGAARPAGKEEEWRELLELLPQDEELLQDLGDAAAANDLAEVQRVNDRYMEIGRKEDAFWRELGVPAWRTYAWVNPQSEAVRTCSPGAI